MYIPGPDGHVGDGVLVAGEEFVVCEPPVEHVELPLDLHGEPVDGVLPPKNVIINLIVKHDLSKKNSVFWVFSRFCFSKIKI